MSDDHSFSMRAKEELCHSIPKHDGCVLAEIAAACQVSGSVVFHSGMGALEIGAETIALAKRLYELIKKRTGISPEIKMISKARLYRQKVYSVALEQDYLQLLTDAGVIKDGLPGTVKGVPEIIQETCCMRSYLRAVFLFCGSAVQPQKAYHVEMALRERQLAEGIVGLLGRLDIKARMTQRKESFVVYMKEADAISDFWANIGAHDALLEHEDTRIMKQVRNDVNRAVNCETANVQKTVNAAMRQRECIMFLERMGMLEKLPDTLRMAAEARLAQPEASIEELADSMSPPISKSGMNHRLRKLVSLAAAEGYNGEV